MIDFDDVVVYTEYLDPDMDSDVCNTDLPAFRVTTANTKAYAYVEPLAERNTWILRFIDSEGKGLFPFTEFEYEDDAILAAIEELRSNKG